MSEMKKAITSMCVPKTSNLRASGVIVAVQQSFAKSPFQTTMLPEFTHRPAFHGVQDTSIDQYSGNPRAHKHVITDGEMDNFQKAWPEETNSIAGSTPPWKDPQMEDEDTPPPSGDKVHQGGDLSSRKMTNVLRQQRTQGYSKPEDSSGKMIEHPHTRDAENKDPSESNFTQKSSVPGVFIRRSDAGDHFQKAGAPPPSSRSAGGFMAGLARAGDAGSRAGATGSGMIMDPSGGSFVSGVANAPVSAGQKMLRVGDAAAQKIGGAMGPGQQNPQLSLKPGELTANEPLDPSDTGEVLPGQTAQSSYSRATGGVLPGGTAPASPRGMSPQNTDWGTVEGAGGSGASDPNNHFGGTGNTWDSGGQDVTDFGRVSDKLGEYVEQDKSKEAMNAYKDQAGSMSGPKPGVGPKKDSAFGIPNPSPKPFAGFQDQSNQAKPPSTVSPSLLNTAQGKPQEHQLQLKPQSQPPPPRQNHFEAMRAKGPAARGSTPLPASIDASAVTGQTPGQDFSQDLRTASQGKGRGKKGALQSTTAATASQAGKTQSTGEGWTPASRPSLSSLEVPSATEDNARQLGQKSPPPSMTSGTASSGATGQTSGGQSNVPGASGWAVPGVPGSTQSTTGKTPGASDPAPTSAGIFASLQPGGSGPGQPPSTAPAATGATSGTQSQTPGTSTPAPTSAGVFASLQPGGSGPGQPPSNATSSAGSPPSGPGQGSSGGSPGSPGLPKDTSIKTATPGAATTPTTPTTPATAKGFGIWINGEPMEKSKPRGISSPRTAVHEYMHRYKHGEPLANTGKPPVSRAQAIAIGLSKKESGKTVHIGSAEQSNVQKMSPSERRKWRRNVKKKAMTKKGFCVLNHSTGELHKAAGAPFVGPRGGKYEDPGLTQPYKEKPIARGSHVDLDKKQLQHTLKNGDYSIVSAGRNPEHSAEAKMPEDHSMFQQRHEKLRQDVSNMGYDHTEIEGHYGGKEKSFLVYHGGDKPRSGKSAVMVHHKGNETASDYKKIRDLGKKHNQDSVIHSKKGSHELHYTTGQNSGNHHKGSGHAFTPEATDYYTNMKLKDGKASKFSLNFDFDKQHSMEDAALKALFGKRQGGFGVMVKGEFPIEHADVDTTHKPEDIEKKFGNWAMSINGEENAEKGILKIDGEEKEGDTVIEHESDASKGFNVYKAGEEINKHFGVMLGGGSLDSPDRCCAVYIGSPYYARSLENRSAELREEAELSSIPFSFYSLVGGKKESKSDKGNAKKREACQKRLSKLRGERKKLEADFVAWKAKEVRGSDDTQKSLGFGVIVR